MKFLALSPHSRPALLWVQNWLTLPKKIIFSQKSPKHVIFVWHIFPLPDCVKLFLTFGLWQLEDEHHHAVHAFISCSWIHNMLIPESITGISCFMFRPKPSQRLPSLHGCALHGFHFHHHVSPGLIPCNYGKNHAVHGTCHGSAWSLCQTQKKVKSWRIIKSFSL